MPRTGRRGVRSVGLANLRIVEPSRRGGETVLLIDDDDAIRSFVRGRLEQAGFSVLDTASGLDGIKTFADHDVDIVLVDVGLPDIDGFSVVRLLREKSNVPIMMMTAATEEIDRVMGLEIGADDYVTKPFLPRELVARVHALLRRSARVEAPAVGRSIFVAGGLSIDTTAREAYVGDDPVLLKAREFDLLAFFAQSPRQVFSREQLLRHVWGVEPGWVNAATVTEHVRRVRLELSRHPTCGVSIVTVRRSGYRFQVL